MLSKRLPKIPGEQLPSEGDQHVTRGKRLSPSRRSGCPARQPRPTETAIDAAVELWLNDGRAQGHSKKTVDDRQAHLERFVWWLKNEAGVSPHLERLTGDLIKRFFTYLREPNAEGRFGTERPNAKKAARPATVHRYFRELRTFSNFCLEEGLIRESPMASVKSPLVPVDQIQPFAPDQIRDLVAAASRTLCPERNRAILLLLLDTGLRVSEAASLTIGAVQRQSGEVSVVGKGGKRRTVYLGISARRAIRLYLTRERSGAEIEEPLFISVGGNRAGEGFTASGIYQTVLECGRLAGIKEVRCSPHTLRHTFAVSFLRGGGNLFELQRLMGHTDLTVLRRYVQLAECDLAKAHRQASPADRLGLR